MKKIAILIFLTLISHSWLSSQNEVFLKIREVFFECNEVTDGCKIKYIPYEVSIFVDIINQREADHMPLLFGSNYSRFRSFDKNYGFFKMILQNDTVDFYTRGEMLYLIKAYDSLDFVIDNDSEDHWIQFQLSDIEQKTYSYPAFSLYYYPKVEDYPKIFETYYLKEIVSVDVSSFIVHYLCGEERLSLQYKQ